ncbi:MULTISPECIES: phosphodiester glycosidase family protein [Psychrobacter]|uniref:Lipoprotein signal peptide n=1 Tax=Psychrobacter glaciei TaxID=619771 RepID=A0ABQ3GS03_9GAMM|nr:MULTISPECIES: phosphodiester glycosidase family protein [Psychrobacter]MBP3945957.1 phosphodiester glycosidase family protein [Psychrobacter sp. K31L]GHD33308.1 lipoprotein signal peptide [Psychrobacter glaciei]
MPSSVFTLPHTLLTAALITLSVSACQPITKQDSDSNTGIWSCQTQNSPFTYSVCRVDADALNSERSSLQLFWQPSDSSQPLLTFDNLLATLPSNQSLSFAMNAGMYNENYAPIGYTVIDGKEIRALNTKEGGGNFHLLPNGVLWWDKAGKVQITESNALNEQLKNDEAEPRYATQSGPMLVIDNEIHPQFNPDSTSLKIRNGAGICDDGSIQFVNSDEPVTFYQFASLFKNDLSCPNALFLDGGIASALYAPSIDKHDKKEMGVMIGLVESKD